MSENSGRNGRILVVDDNRMNRMLLERALRQQGYDVATAENGRLALAMLDAGPFDVVLLDILMPELDGYATLAHIKGSSTLRHIPVIMISAVEEMDSVVRCIEMGATDYLPKPFNPALLRARINTSLAEKRLRDLEREYLEQVGYVARAAAAVEAATFDPASLDQVAARDDALGQLARVFQRMAAEVHLREQRLKQQLRQLHSDIEEMRKAQVEPLCVYLPMDRRQALLHGETLPDRTTGAALFADISGFVPLTAALARELGRQRGAEELTALLNQVYGALIAEVHRYGGSVVGFSGDAITCWLDGDGGLRAIACGLALQEAMAAFASVNTPAGIAVSLSIKVAVATGPVRRFLVGDPDIQKIDVVAGRMLDFLSMAEHHAGSGEVVATEDLVAATSESIEISEWRTDAQTGQRFAVVRNLATPVAYKPWPEIPPNILPDEQCRPWLLASVYRRLSSGTSQFLAELRPAVALFLKFGGIDYDGDDQAGDRLDFFVCWVQGVVDRHEGAVIQLTFGDKGSYLYAAFGAPLAHDDDAVRAVESALEIQSPPAELAFVTGIQIGIAAGRVRAGAYGSSTQRTYGALGEGTNLAARLMQAATDGILCDESVFEAAHQRLSFRALPSIQIKGRARPIAVYCPAGDAARLPRSGTAIQALIDRLSPTEQLTLKVASVAGQAFSAAMVSGILSALLPGEPQGSQVDEHLRKLEDLDLIVKRLPDPGFAFSSPDIRRIAYTSMLFVQRRQLHRLAAEWYERTSHDLAPYYSILAEHWRQAEEPARAIEYLEKAGQEARAVGALEEAERYIQESLELSAQSAVLSEGFYESAAADYAGARQYALDRLERELPPQLIYHNLWHTQDEVLPAVRRLAAAVGVVDDDLQLLEIAAVYHDLGFTVQRQEHERLAAEIAGEVLPGFGLSAAQVATIQGMIMATQLPQSPHTILEQILADADLDVLGREDFAARNELLRDELASAGTRISARHWYGSQLETLQRHRYWTAAARNLRDAGKQKNIKLLQQLLASSEESSQE